MLFDRIFDRLCNDLLFLVTETKNPCFYEVSDTFTFSKPLNQNR